jgi:hypothetical protein
MQPPGEIAVPIQSWADGDAPAWGKGPGGQAEDPRSLEERAADYVTRRQRAYLAEGWAHFKEGRYRRAYDAFNLAESVNADDVETRASIKLAMMYAATGAKQYGLARAALGWLLQPDPRTGQLRDPRFAQRTPDVAAQCASEQTFARDFIEAVRAAAAGTGAPASVRALQVMVFWGGREGHRVDALSYARRLAEDAEAELPWSRVYAAIRLAQAAAPDSAERGADLGLPDFVSLGLPFERGNPER